MRASASYLYLFKLTRASQTDGIMIEGTTEETQTGRTMQSGAIEENMIAMILEIGIGIGITIDEKTTAVMSVQENQILADLRRVPALLKCERSHPALVRS